ncbi:MAG: Na+/H+ antiporter subunit E [Microthrixaceae bacterium]
MNRLLAPALVFIVWIALWGELTWANALSGLVVVALIGWLIRPVPRAHVVNPIGLVKLLAVFSGRLVTSSVSVILAVVAPTPERLRSGVVTVRLSHDSPLVATIVADAISLTPGTLTLDAEPDGNTMLLQVHVLGLGDPADLRADIARLEQTVLGAVRPKEAGEVAR